MLAWKFDIWQQNPLIGNTGSIHIFIFTNYNKNQSLKKKLNTFYDFNSDKTKL